MLEGRGYCITPANILCHEMIGLEVKARSGKNGLVTSGRVVDETKNVFIIESAGVERMVAKKSAEFEFTLGKEKTLVRGDGIMYRPEHRVKALGRVC